MQGIRLDKKTKTIKVVNRKENITLRHNRGNLKLQHVGRPGPAGEDGRSVELRNDGEVIQYRQTNDSGWTDLVPLSEIAGPQGPQGVKGDKGDTGDTGATGPAGPQGPVGEIGPQGPQGEQGLRGPKGDTGASGAQGPKGDKGDPGAPGAQGQKGDNGDTGATGPIGPAGPQGATGATGPQGIQGISGANGTDGTNGVDGADGVGVVAGGTTGQVLAKVDATDYNTYWKDDAEGIADPGSNGILARTALNTTSARTITGTTNQVNVSNGNGVSGNPVLSLPQSIHTGASPTFAGQTINGDISLPSVSGTKIGTSSDQKLAFYGSTPIVQPSGNALIALSNLGLVTASTLAISDTTGLQEALDNKLDDTQFSGLSKITVGTSAPSSPAVGDLWVDTN